MQVRTTVYDKTGALGAGLDRRIAKFLDANDRAMKDAAKKATTQTRASFKHKRDVIAPRPGRSSTGGQLKKHLKWKVQGDEVGFDMQHANREAPHWIIQEIGTGERATIKRAGIPNPQGRPRKGASYVRTIPTQKGRRVSAGLVFATGGRYSQPGSRRNEQLHLASQVTGAPARPARIRISREIQGQHFVKKGGQEGFREYKQSVLAAARQSFAKKGGRP